VDISLPIFAKEAEQGKKDDDEKKYGKIISVHAKASK
jgi:hypothetical protein